jgi:hypothetical protein
MAALATDTASTVEVVLGSLRGLTDRQVLEAAELDQRLAGFISSPVFDELARRGLTPGSNS